MTPIQITLCCVFALSLAGGQILFKQAANSWNIAAQTNPGPLAIVSPSLVAAAIIYGLTALLWIYILRSVPLTRAYVFSIAGSALVPIAAYVIFREPVSAKYWAGFALMLGGIYLCVT